MVTPSHHPASICNPGPSRSLLQSLLEEINGASTPTVLRDPESIDPKDTSHAKCRDSRRSPQSSVWVGGGLAAQEARSRLREVDEIRLRKASSTGPGDEPDSLATSFRRNSSPVRMQSYGDGFDRRIRPIRFKDVKFEGVKFDNTTVLSIDEAVAPGRQLMSPCKRDRRANSISQPSLKRMRIFEAASNRCHRSSLPDLGIALTIQEDGSNKMRLIRGASFTERTTRSSPLLTEKYALPDLSSFRPDITTPQVPQPSSPPVYNNTLQTTTSTPDTTPSWMQPLHLVDDEVSIYKNVHGDSWQDHPLCLYCFRQHGNFHKVLRNGCEVCGEDEVLTSHYWEPGAGPC